MSGAIRRAGPGDLDRLVELWREVAAHHAHIGPLFTLRSDARPRVRGLLARDLDDPDAAIFVLEREGELVGFCSVHVDRSVPIFEEDERAEVTDLFVQPHARRAGVGRELVAAALRWAAERGVGRVEARVAARNAEGQAFWRALGFDDLMDVLSRRL